MNKKLQRTLLGAALLATLGSTAAPAQYPAFKGKETAPLSRMRKVTPTQKWAGFSNSRNQQRIAPNFTTPAGDEFQYLNGPDGTQWYAICNYDTDEVELEGGYVTDHILKGFSYTIYDSKFNEIGTVRDKIDLQEGEIKCASLMLDVTVTRRFFKSDDKYEVMVSFAMNTPDFVNNTRTKIYAIENLADGEYSVPISVLPGYPVDAIDGANDKWTENF